MFLGDQWQAEGVDLAFSAQTHVKNTVPKFEELFGLTMKSAKTPMSPDLQPEMDNSPFVSLDNAAKCRSIVGSLNWLVTLGRTDVHCATSSLSRHNMKP